jgi:hypothetical protein
MKRIEKKSPATLIDELITAVIKYHFFKDDKDVTDAIRIRRSQLINAIDRELGESEVGATIDDFTTIVFKCFMAQEDLFACSKADLKIKAGEVAIKIHSLNAERNNRIRTIDAKLGFEDITQLQKTYKGENMIAVTHPGKHGDVLYSIPCAKYLCESLNCQMDFFTSPHCSTLYRIMEYQDYVNSFTVLGELDDFWGGWGIQPWDMRKWFDETKYNIIYQLGFENFPDQQVHTFYLKELGITDVQLELTDTFSYPALETTKYSELLDMEYICIAPRGDVDFHATYNAIMDRSPIPIVQIGGVGETMEHDNMLDYTCIDWLETLSVLCLFCPMQKHSLAPFQAKGPWPTTLIFPRRLLLIWDMAQVSECFL